MSLALFIELNRRLWGVVLPTILSGLVLVGVETVSLITVGQLDDTYAIAGVGLSIIFTNFVSLSPLTALNSTISVLVSIAYGRCDYQECETILHRGRLICAIASIPLFFIQLLQYDILIFCGVDAEVASYAYQYGIFLFLAMIMHMQFDCYRNYLNATG